MTPDLGQALIGLALLAAMTIGAGVTTSIAHWSRHTSAAGAARRALRYRVTRSNLFDHLRGLK